MFFYWITIWLQNTESSWNAFIFIKSQYVIIIIIIIKCRLRKVGHQSSPFASILSSSFYSNIRCCSTPQLVVIALLSSLSSFCSGCFYQAFQENIRKLASTASKNMYLSFLCINSNTSNLSQFSKSQLHCFCMHCFCIVLFLHPIDFCIALF